VSFRFRFPVFAASVLLAAALSTASGRAVEVQAPPGAGPSLRDDVRRTWFAERKAQVLRQLARRAGIVSTAQACVAVAEAPPQLRACLQQEQLALEALRAEDPH